MNKFIYIPSLSAGAYATALKNNTIFFKDTPNAISSRYYSDDFPEEFRYKYFLVTAGYHYKNLNYVESHDLSNSFVFGDSGGYQICMGRVKFTQKLLEDTFRFLENNSTVAANLDIPTKGKLNLSFEKCLELSFPNFKYFADNQSGKTKYLNVLHGLNPEQIETWYNQVKGMPFHGWACGSVYRKVNWMFTLAFLLKNGEFHNQNEYLHIFGLSGVLDLLICAQIQKSLNAIGSKVIITTDSSSPSLNALYGAYVQGVDYKNTSWRQMKLLKNQGIDYNIDHPLPCIFNCPICRSVTYKDFQKYSTLETQYMILHNTIMYAREAELIQKMVYAPNEILSTCLPKDVILLLDSIDRIFLDGDPIHTFKKFEQLYRKFDGAEQIKIQDNDNFF